MASNGSAPFFSVILPTRNRPKLFQRALQSVLSQSFDDREIIAVVDGSTDACLERYRELEAEHPEVAFLYLVNRPSGHGQSYSMNYGVFHCRGKYLCFLDDDDHWIDDTYLENAHANIQASDQPVDMHYSNQKAYYPDDISQTDSVWLEDLLEPVKELKTLRDSCYRVDTDLLLTSAGFGHLNCSIFERLFYDSIGGMDESIRYENDRDVYIRSIDAAATILYYAHYVSHHNIPDVSKHENMSTVGTDIEKKLYQMRVYDKGICFSNNPAVVRFCRKAKVYELKHAASILAAKGDYSRAIHYAREALVAGFNLRWLGYTLYLCLLSLRRRDRAA